MMIRAVGFKYFHHKKKKKTYNILCLSNFFKKAFFTLLFVLLLLVLNLFKDGIIADLKTSIFKFVESLCTSLKLIGL